MKLELYIEIRNSEIIKSSFNRFDSYTDLIPLYDLYTKPYKIRHPNGTDFQQRVWKSLCMIPIGRTKTYKQIAEHIGNPNAYRAVANACAANEVAFFIPCHRVINSDGSVGGYKWGVELKYTLLEFEQRVAPL